LARIFGICLISGKGMDIFKHPRKTYYKLHFIQASSWIRRAVSLCDNSQPSP
jgi:hypothetical protein